MFSKTIKLFIMCVITGFFLTSCGSDNGPDLNPDPNKKSQKAIPDWYLNTPKAEGFKYETSMATSKSMQMAVDKATLNAVNNLQASLESDMETYRKNVQEERGFQQESDIMESFSNTIGQTIAGTLKGYEVVKKDFQQNGEIWTAFVLIEYDEGAAHQKMLDAIKRDKELYDAIRASELMEEMEDKVEAYRKRREQ